MPPIPSDPLSLTLPAWRMLRFYACLYMTYGRCHVYRGVFVRKMHVYLSTHVQIRAERIAGVRMVLKLGIHACMHACMHAWLRTYICYMCPCMHACMRAHVRVYLGTYVHTCVQTYLKTHLSMYLHAYLHTYVYTCVKKYTRAQCATFRRSWASSLAAAVDCCLLYFGRPRSRMC